MRKHDLAVGSPCFVPFLFSLEGGTKYCGDCLARIVFLEDGASRVRSPRFARSEENSSLLGSTFSSVRFHGESKKVTSPTGETTQ